MGRSPDGKEGRERPLPWDPDGDACPREAQEAPPEEAPHKTPQEPYDERARTDCMGEQNPLKDDGAETSRLDPLDAPKQEEERARTDWVGEPDPP